MIYVISDSWALLGRHMRHIVRVPEKLLSVTIMPVAFVLAFGYLLGSAMTIPGVNYREYFMAGVFTQVMLAGLTNTALGVCEDLNNGLVDRFRSLPMSRSAVLIGRTVSDLVLCALACLVMAVVGYAIGWRVHGTFLETVGGFGLLLLLGYVAIWIGALLGLALRNPEAVGSLGFIIVMPFMFLSNAFISLGNLPAWLRAVANWNPISAVAGGARELWGNGGTTATDTFPSQHPVQVALFIMLAVLIVVVPLAVRSYSRTTSR